MGIKQKFNKAGNAVLQAAVDTATGKWLSTRFFSRNWGIILALVGLLMIYITNRYQCAVSMERIKALENELQIAKSECIREKSYYISNIREAAMQQRIDNLGLKLSASNKPPYILTLD